MFTKKKTNIRLQYIDNLNKLFKKKYFILAALNLAFLSYFYKKIFYKKIFLVLWPDGFFAKILTKKKFPGWLLISKIKLPNNIKKITVIGNLNIKEKIFLRRRFKILIQHHDIGNGDIKILINKMPKKFFENVLYLITLPTPKQELLSYKMFNRSKKLKIICIGGGLSIASGCIKKCPKFLYNLNLEFLWRLRTDTYRRLIRLVLSFLNYNFYKIKSNINIIFQKI